MDGVENSENPWPEEFAELKSIEESLTCGICYEYIQTAVMTPCSHNYCTLCIRRYLNFKNECPACFNPVHDTDLRVNRSLDNIRQSFFKLRENLKLCMKGLPIRSALERRIAGENSSPVKSRINQIISTPTSSGKNPNNSRNEEATTPVKSGRFNQMVASPQTPSRIDSTAHGENIEKHLFSPGTSGIAPIFNNPVRFKILGKKDDIGPTVPCPVCSVSVSETHINRHLDDCLKRQNNTSGPVQLESKLKPIPKLVLNLMKDSELRRRLKEYGCSTAGDLKALKGRLNRFYILYNAERDKTVQRSITEIVKLCEEEEQLERKAALSATGNVLTFSKPTIVKPVKGQNEIYCEANKSSFNKLIEQVRKRNPRKKKTAGDEELSSLYEDLVTETITNVSNDSDSGTSGHQQRYSNDGVTISESVDLVDADSNCEGIAKQQENPDMLFSSLLEDSSTDSENEQVVNPVFNKRLASHTFDGVVNSVSSSTNSDSINSNKSDAAQKTGWTLKKPRMSMSLVDNNIQELNGLLESIDDDDQEFKDISLNTTADSVESNASKVAENEELSSEMNGNKKELNESARELESEMERSIDESILNDKENNPSGNEIEHTFQRPARKRGRPRRFTISDESPTKANRHLQNVSDKSTIYEVAVDGSLDEIESSPEKTLKRRKAAQTSTESESEPETPTRNLRKRQIRTPSKR